MDTCMNESIVSGCSIALPVLFFHGKVSTLRPGEICPVVFAFCPACVFSLFAEAGGRLVPGGLGAEPPRKCAFSLTGTRSKTMKSQGAWDEVSRNDTFRFTREYNVY